MQFEYNRLKTSFAHGTPLVMQAVSDLCFIQFSRLLHMRLSGFLLEQEEMQASSFLSFKKHR